MAYVTNRNHTSRTLSCLESIASITPNSYACIMFIVHTISQTKNNSILISSYADMRTIIHEIPSVLLASCLWVCLFSRFVQEGAYVFITGRRQSELDIAVKQIG